MKTGTVSIELETRAAEALTAMLGRASVIKLMELKRESPPRARFAAILARIEVFGHSHTLACEVNPDGEPGRLRKVLREWQSDAASLDSDATPVFIAPYLSPEAQALCKQARAGFLDFEGNARLSIGEVFIGMRSLPRDEATRVSAARHPSPVRSSASSISPKGLPKFSRKQAEVALSA